MPNLLNASFETIWAREQQEVFYKRTVSSVVADVSKRALMSAGQTLTRTYRSGSVNDAPSVYSRGTDISLTDITDTAETLTVNKQFADGLSETKYSMWATIIGNITNVVINYFLIYGIWIFPKWGIVGAAVGTIASRFVMLGFMHYMMNLKPKFHPYFKGFSLKEIKKEVNQKIIKIGMPSAMQMFFEVALFTGSIS